MSHPFLAMTALVIAPPAAGKTTLVQSGEIRGAVDWDALWRQGDPETWKDDYQDTPRRRESKMAQCKLRLSRAVNSFHVPTVIFSSDAYLMDLLRAYGGVLYLPDGSPFVSLARTLVWAPLPGIVMGRLRRRMRDTDHSWRNEEVTRRYAKHLWDTATAKGNWKPDKEGVTWTTDESLPLWIPAPDVGADVVEISPFNEWLLMGDMNIRE
jgi:hypothetical protein